MLSDERVLLGAVIATTTSAPFSVEGFKRIGFQFFATAITAGNGVFIVEGTIDGIHWVTLSTLIDNVTNTNVQNLTRVASKTISVTDTSAIVWLDELVGLKAVRVKVTRTTDGTYSASVLASG